VAVSGRERSKSSMHSPASFSNAVSAADAAKITLVERIASPTLNPTRKLILHA
jgi:hypothetical protein